MKKYTINEKQQNISNISFIHLKNDVSVEKSNLITIDVGRFLWNICDYFKNFNNI